MTELKKEKPPVPYTMAIFTRRIGKKKRWWKLGKAVLYPWIWKEHLWRTLAGVHSPNSTIVCSSRFCFIFISKKICLTRDYQVPLFILHVDELWRKQRFQVWCTFLSKASLCQDAPSCSLVTFSVYEFEKEHWENARRKCLSPISWWVTGSQCACISTI